jgi:DNA-binding transcriptional regulator YbjK
VSKLIRMPDGTLVRFGDEFDDAEIGALLQQKFPQLAGKPQPGDVVTPKDTGLAPVTITAPGEMAPQAQAEQPWWAPKNTLGDLIHQVTKDGDESYASQAMSGAIKGAGGMVGLVADAGNQMWRAADAGLSKVGLDVIPDRPEDTNYRGSIPEQLSESGIAAPASDDPTKKFVSRVGEEVGAALLPGIGIAGFARQPARMLASELGAATTSGLGAATANAVLPGNDTAELVGQLAGGFGPMAVGGMFRRNAGRLAAPATEELEALKDAAYQRVDSLGVRYSAQDFSTLLRDVEGQALTDNISATRHEAALDLINDLNYRYRNGLTLTELDQLRQEVSRDLIRSGDAANQHFGYIIRNAIDDFIDAAPGGPLAGEGAEAINEARSLNSRLRKTELLEDLLHTADLRAAASGSGGNINNTIRAQLNRILTNPRMRAGFSDEELAAIEDVVRQGRGEDLLRLVGKLSPSGNGMMAALNLGATAANPLMAIPGGVGLAAKTVADAGTRNKAAILRALVARGDNARPPVFSPQDEQVAAALLPAQVAANQNEMDPIAKALLDQQRLKAAQGF